MTIRKFSNSIIRKIVNKNFKWGDLNPKYNNVELLKTNVFCPMHEHNYKEGNAKFYYNNETGLWVLHCFVEHRSFDVYDYLKKVICEERQIYSSPLDFLKEHMSNSEFLGQYKAFQDDEAEFIESSFEKKLEYIDNTFNSSESISDYIEKLYTA